MLSDYLEEWGHLIIALIIIGAVMASMMWFLQSVGVNTSRSSDTVGSVMEESTQVVNNYEVNIDKVEVTNTVTSEDTNKDDNILFKCICIVVVACAITGYGIVKIVFKYKLREKELNLNSSEG